MHEATATGQGSLDSGEIEVSVQVTLPLDEEEVGDASL